MSRSEPPYPITLRARIVALVREGRSLEELAAEHGPSVETIRRWVEQADRSGVRPDDGRARRPEKSGGKERHSGRDSSWRHW